MTDLTYSLLPIDSLFLDDFVNLPGFIHEQTGRSIICISHVEFLTGGICLKMEKLPKDARIIGLNRQLKDACSWDPIDTKYAYQHLPFIAINRSGLMLDYLSPEQALAAGNFFLCYKCDVRRLPVFSKAEGMFLSLHEYRYHGDPEKTAQWKDTHPPYVNMDRDSDNIGGSSWDGNLVRWFQAGFTTRIQYGVQAGLFPEDE